MKFRASTGLILWAVLLLKPSVGIAVENCNDKPLASSAAQAVEQDRVCRERVLDQRIGKYFCYVKSMAGIQYPMEGEGDLKEPNMKAIPYVGKIKPPQDKFFIEISKNVNFDLCKEGAETRKFCEAGKVYERFLFKSEANAIFSYGYSSEGYRFTGGEGTFILYGTNDFRSFTTAGSSYVADGACTKIN